jgi:hypothetical protein
VLLQLLLFSLWPLNLLRKWLNMPWPRLLLRLLQESAGGVADRRNAAPSAAGSNVWWPCCPLPQPLLALLPHAVLLPPNLPKPWLSNERRLLW